MSTLHMDPEHVRQTAERLDQTAGAIYDSSETLQNSLTRLDWQGGDSDDFVAGLRQVVRQLRRQAQEARTLAQRLRSEVDEWLAADTASARTGPGSGDLALAGGGAALAGSVLGASTSPVDAYTAEYRQMSWKERFQEEERLRGELAASRNRLQGMRSDADIQADISEVDTRIAELERRRAEAQAKADAWYNKVLPDWDKEHRPFPGDGDGVPWRTEGDDYEDQVAQRDAELMALRAQRQGLQDELVARQQEQARLVEVQERQAALGGLLSTGISRDGPSPKYPYFSGTDATNCTKYAAHQRNVPCSGDAYQWNEQATAGGFETGNRPVPGSVLVMEPDAIHSRGAQQSDPTYGHVAIVESATDLGNGSYRVHISEGNWGGGYNERDLVISTTGNTANVKGVPVSFIYDRQR